MCILKNNLIGYIKIYNFQFVIFQSYLFILDYFSRLLTKLCTVVDRADLNGDASWSEYGDRYMLKLFRDYIFHQVHLWFRAVASIQQTI